MVTREELAVAHPSELGAGDHAWSAFENDAGGVDPVHDVVELVVVQVSRVPVLFDGARTILVRDRFRLFAEPFR